MSRNRLTGPAEGPDPSLSASSECSETGEQSEPNDAGTETDEMSSSSCTIDISDLAPALLAPRHRFVQLQRAAQHDVRGHFERESSRALALASVRRTRRAADVESNVTAIGGNPLPRSVHRSPRGRRRSRSPLPSRGEATNPLCEARGGCARDCPRTPGGGAATAVASRFARHDEPRPDARSAAISSLQDCVSRSPRPHALRMQARIETHQQSWRPGPGGSARDRPVTAPAEGGPGDPLPGIEEVQQSDPAQRMAVLAQVCSEYNAMHAQGRIGDMLKSHAVGFDDLPRASIFWTSRPVTAAFTRYTTGLTFLLLSAVVLMDPILNVQNMLQGSRAPKVRELRVERLLVYDNVFPNLSADVDSPENKRMEIVDVGVYLYHENFRPHQHGCITNMTSPSSFTISCEEQIAMHGFWVQVLPSRDPPQHGYAAIQHAPFLPGPMVPPDQEFIVVGTGQKVRGVKWLLTRSVTEGERIYRVPIAARDPIQLRPQREVFHCFFYFVMSALGVCAGVSALAGRPVAGKRSFLGILVCVAGVNFAYLVIDSVAYASSTDKKLAGILVGERYHVVVDPSLHLLFGDHTIIAILLVQAHFAAVFLAMSILMYLEKFVLVSLAFCTLLLAMAQTLQVTGGLNGNKAILAASFTSFIFCVYNLGMQMRVKRRIRQLVCQDKAYYDGWWHTLSSLRTNQLVLLELRRQVSLSLQARNEQCSNVAMSQYPNIVSKRDLFDS